MNQLKAWHGIVNRAVQSSLRRSKGGPKPTRRIRNACGEIQEGTEMVSLCYTSQNFLKDARTNAVLRFRKESFAGNKLSGNRRKAVPALRGDSRFRLWESRLDSVAVNPRSWDEVNQLILQITSTILN